MHEPDGERKIEDCVTYHQRSKPIQTKLQKLPYDSVACSSENNKERQNYGDCGHHPGSQDEEHQIAAPDIESGEGVGCE